MALLDDLAADVHAALGGELRDAEYFAQQVVGDDGYGNPVYGWVGYPCEGSRANYDAEYASAAGIPRTNVRIEIIARSLEITPATTDRVFIENTWWIVLQVETDPATAVWVLECQASEDPTP